MTIKELKELIKNHPEEMMVVIQHSRNEFISVRELSTETITLYSEEGKNPYMLYRYPNGKEGDKYEAFVVNRE